MPLRFSVNSVKNLEINSPLNYCLFITKIIGVANVNPMFNNRARIARVADIRSPKFRI